MLRCVAILGLVLSWSACDDFLSIEPRDQLSRADLFEDMRGAESAVIGLYQLIGKSDYYQTRMPIYADVQGNMQALDDEKAIDASDVLGKRGEYIALYGFSVQAIYNQAAYDNLYRTAYTVLYQANDVIDALQTVTVGPADRIASLTAEARALRALIHFDLVRLFAQAPAFSSDASHPGVVLVMQIPGIGDFRKRATVAEVYEAIKSDLEAAETGIVDDFSKRTTKPHWLDKAVLQGLLARVAAYRRDWEASYDWAERSLSQFERPLITNQEYLAEWRTGSLSETFWELDLQRLVEDVTTPTLDSPARVIGIGADQPFLQVSQQLVSLFSPGDLRRQLIVSDSLTKPRLTTKLPFAPDLIRNPILLRRSEVLLLRAEAAVELGRLDQALADLTTIARRADPDATLPALDAEALRTAVRLERRKELAFEGHHFFDLGRWGAPLDRENCASFVKVCRLAYHDYRYILPIPFDALQRNPNLTQNDGY